MGSVFVNYGVKAGGGPAFLKRSRTTVGQLQTRTRTGYTYSQKQTRTRSGFERTSCTWAQTFTSHGPHVSICDRTRSCSFTGQTYWDCPGCVPGQNFTYCRRYAYEATVSTTCTWYGWGGWSNTSSCSASFPSCGTQRDCRTVTACSWRAYSAWSNVSSCSASSPGCSNGAFQRACQTVYSWGAWSAYEEVDVCVPQSPSPSANAVQIECVAI